ncbi:MAG: TolC family protein [Campylobacterota bacterium]|nr:TolC family protein [Campylobacterota bacterium]
MKKFTTLILMLSTLACGNQVYTVDELILKALENSPELQITSSEHKASTSRTNIASSSYLPKLDLHLSAGSNGMSDVPTSDMVSDTLILGTLSLKQIVYDFGKTSANIASFKYDSNSFDMENKQKISDKKRDVKFAYYDVLKAIALIKVHKENVKLNKAQLYRSEKYFDAGIRTKIDISDAKVELIKAKLNLKKAEYDLKLRYASLDRVVGFKEIESDYSVYSKELDLQNLCSSLSDYALNLKDSINYAYKNRYELKNYIWNLKSAKAKARLANSDYYPSLYLGADYTKQEVDKFKSSVPEDRWQASLNLDWNLYQGGSTKASTMEKRVQVDISQFELQNSKLFIKKETTEAYINLYKTKDSMELSQTLLKVSNEKFNQTGKRYEHGLSDYIELQQSRQGYIDAMTSLVINYYQYYQSIAYLDNAIGK